MGAPGMAHFTAHLESARRQCKLRKPQNCVVVKHQNPPAQELICTGDEALIAIIVRACECREFALCWLRCIARQFMKAPGLFVALLSLRRAANVGRVAGFSGFGISEN